MLDIGGGDGLVATLAEEDAEGGLGLCAGCLEFGGIFLPLLALDLHLHLGEALVFLHRVVLDEADFECGLAALRTAGPEGEAVGGSLLDGDAEEAFVLETRELVAMARVAEAHVVGIVLEGTVVLQLEVAIGAPAHQRLVELERAVLHHLGIEATVGSVVDILEEDAVHRRLYGGPKFLCVHVEDVILSRSREGCSQEQKCSQLSHISFVISLNGHKIKQKIRVDEGFF